MKFGLPEKLLDRLKNVFSEFEEIDKVVLYGSRATGRFREGSDIDLVIYAEGLTNDDYTRLMDRIDQLNSPYKFDVSLHHQIDSANLSAHIKEFGQDFYTKKVLTGS